MDWLRAHAKFIPPLVAAIAIIFVPQATVDMILAIVAAALTLIVPNDQAAIERIYPSRRR